MLLKSGFWSLWAIQFALRYHNGFYAVKWYGLQSVPFCNAYIGCEYQGRHPYRGAAYTLGNGTLLGVVLLVVVTVRQHLPRWFYSAPCIGSSDAEESYLPR